MTFNIFGKLKSALTFRKVIRLTCTLLILTAFLLPWWRIHMVHGVAEGAISVSPHGIYGSFPETVEVEFKWTETRTEYLQLFTGVYLGCVALGFLGTLLKGKKGTVLLVVTGIILLTIVYMFHSRIVQTCSDVGRFGLSAQGVTVISLEASTSLDIRITTGFQSGFYLATVVGLLCIVSIPLEYVYSKFRQRLRPKKARMDGGKLTVL